MTMIGVLLANPPSHRFMKWMLDGLTERALQRRESESYSSSFVKKEDEDLAKMFVRYLPSSSLTCSQMGVGMEATDVKSIGTDLQYSQSHMLSSCVTRFSSVFIVCAD